MRRADRLFHLVMILRRGGLMTAEAIGKRLEVSPRTVYRDIADLINSGIPIRGEAGMGYVLQKGYELPPIMFNAAELEALLVATRMLKSWVDTELSDAASSALRKIEAVLPEPLGDALSESHLHVPEFHRYPVHWMAPLRKAMSDGYKILLAYSNAQDEWSERTIRPLGLYYWGRVWTLVAWCELRDDFRHFRVDRIHELKILSETFEPTPGRTLEDFLATIKTKPRVRKPQDGGCS